MYEIVHFNEFSTIPGRLTRKKLYMYANIKPVTQKKNHPLERLLPNFDEKIKIAGFNYVYGEGNNRV